MTSFLFVAVHGGRATHLLDGAPYLTGQLLGLRRKRERGLLFSGDTLLNAEPPLTCRVWAGCGASFR